MKHAQKRINQAGFTLIELMVATIVFATVLLLVAYGIIQISRSYYKGITITKTQQTARAIIDQVSQSIQFGSASGVVASPAPNPPNSQAFCLNGNRYSYVIGQQLAPNNTNHVLVVDTPPCSGSSPSPQNLSVGGGLTTTSRELIGPNMRLSKFSISSPGVNTNLWEVTVKVTYGDSDLLCSPSVSGDCSSTTTSSSLGNGDIICKPFVGNQFCAISELKTVVQTRAN